MPTITMHLKLNRKVTIIMAGVLFILFMMQIVSLLLRDKYFINLSPSLPVGFYKIFPPENLKRDDIIIFTPEPPLTKYIYNRHWLPSGWPLIKKIGAVPGDSFCIEGKQFLINGHFIGEVFDIDSQGLPLPHLAGCHTVERNYILPIATNIPNSFDGRYFGAIPVQIIKGKACPVWTF